jgi:hypothetical protein
LNFENDHFSQKTFSTKVNFERNANKRLLINKIVRDWCGDNDFQLIDLERDLSNYSLYSYDQLHLTADGSLKVAERIVESIGE